MASYQFDWRSNPVEVDLSAQILELEVAEEESFFSVRGRSDLESRLINPENPSLGTLSVVPEQIGPRLYARLADILDFWRWVPAQSFAVKARSFDARLFAVEEVSKRCFFPPADSEKERLMKALLGEGGLPDGDSLVDDFIQRIRDGRLDTTPGPHSGVDDYQLHALAPLLFPESERLVVGPKYRGELEAQFRALSAQKRETRHRTVARLPEQGHLPRPLTLEPFLTIEPLAEHYRRRAELYRFLRQVLMNDVLDQARRTLPVGKREESLLDELAWMEQLFRGAHVIVREELGFESIPEADLPAAMLTRRWLQEWRSDSDILTDARCVVPLSFDKERGLTKVLVMMGFLATTLEARFRQVPQVRVFGPGGRQVTGEKPLFLSSNKYNTLCPVAEEVYVRRVPDRKEFRELCDTHGSREAILRALRA